MKQGYSSIIVYHVGSMAREASAAQAASFKQASLTMGISCRHQARECTRWRTVCRGQRKGLQLTSNWCLDLLCHPKNLTTSKPSKLQNFPFAAGTN